jgi:hypothetical protein
VVLGPVPGAAEVDLAEVDAVAQDDDADPGLYPYPKTIKLASGGGCQGLGAARMSMLRVAL